jgi:hypothetical protein
VDLKRLFDSVDARPFKPFTVELLSGRQIQVTHPDNIFIIPNRQKVFVIEVYNPDTEWQLASFYPDGIAALLFGNGKGNGG